MSELAEAIARLQQSVARLDSAAAPAAPGIQDPRVTELATAIAERIDAAVARIDRLLEGEG
jgi:hypothetical protein